MIAYLLERTGVGSKIINLWAKQGLNQTSFADLLKELYGPKKVRRPHFGKHCFKPSNWNALIICCVMFVQCNQKWARSLPYGDLEDHDHIIKKMCSWRSKIRSPKLCDFEDQDRDLEDQDHSKRGSGANGGGGKLQMLNAVSVLTINGNGSADFANNVKHLTFTNFL